MDRTYWQKQTLESPLFDDLIWCKPQQKSLSGKLLIVGGNLHAIASPIKSCDVAVNQIIGGCTVVMPDKTRKLLGPKLPPNIELMPSTPSGSFSTKSKDKLTALMLQNNATLFAGDFGHSSETAILLEELLKVSCLQTYCGDALDYWSKQPLAILRKPNTLLVLDMAQLQKYAIGARVSQAFTSNMDLLVLIEKLHEFTNIFASHFITMHQNQFICASHGQVISTKIDSNTNFAWQSNIAAAASVWWLQNKNKALQAIATAITQVSF